MFNYKMSARLLREEVSANAKSLAEASVYKIESIMRSVQKVPESLAYALENTTYTKDELERMLTEVVEKNPEIYGATIAFEPYAFDPEIEEYAPYYYSSAGEVKRADLAAANYNYFKWDWYKRPEAEGRSLWSEPYYDEGGGNILMATYSVPFYTEGRSKGRLKGIVTADVSLKWLTDIISSITIMDSGYGFLLSTNGTFVTHPAEDLVMGKTIFAVADEKGLAVIRDAGEKMVKGEKGCMPFYSPFLNKQCFMCFSPVPSTGWSLAVLFPEDELLSGITDLTKKMVLIASAGTILLLLLVVFIARNITRPLRAMVKATDIISTGNLDAELPEQKDKDEVGQLTAAFNHMQTSLKAHIEELTLATAAKERIESELDVAREIQQSILPKTFPAFPEHPEVDVYAFMRAARQVGGDFYDYYFIDDDRLCFVIGDVSGKGVPASLFMAVTKTLLKATTTSTLSPDKILEKVNNELSRDDQQGFFVTVFFGIVNIRTGEVAFSNGGHNTPMIIKSDGRVEEMEHIGGMVVGVMEGVEFKTGKVQLEEKDSIFLYTDGVTEAMDKNKEQFTEERLESCLEQLSLHEPKEMIEAMMKKIEAFTGNNPQSDDITMMAIEYKGERHG